jgi:hypothetical protein
MLGCVTVFGLLLGGICGCGLGLGLLLHWLVPAMDRGMATLCGLVATGVALLAFGQLMTPADPTATDAATSPGACADSRRAPQTQARSGAMSSSVRPAVSGKHLATSNAPGNARMARAPIATQWDATTP